MSGEGNKVSGVGLGMRWECLEEVLDGPPLDLAFWEVCPENSMHRGGYYPHALARIAERYPVFTHGLTLSIGASDPAPLDYLTELRYETRCAPGLNARRSLDLAFQVAELLRSR